MNVPREECAVQRPYLTRLAAQQPKEQASGLTDRCEYDTSKDIVVIKDTRQAAVLDPSARPLVTKKADVEKGEDRKDTWL